MQGNKGYRKMIISSDKLNRGIELLLSIPKSFYVSWRLTSFRDAFRLPILCRYNVKVISTKGRKLRGQNECWF